MEQPSSYSFAFGFDYPPFKNDVIDTGCPGIKLNSNAAGSWIDDWLIGEGYRLA